MSNKALDDAPYTIAVDFDDTLAPGAYYPELPPEPLPGAAWMLRQWRRAGCRILIYTARTSPRHLDWRKQVHQIERWLQDWGLPYDAVVADGKPLADVYIDDRAYAFHHWGDVGLLPENLRKWYRRFAEQEEAAHRAAVAQRPPDRCPDGYYWIGLAGPMGAGKSTVAQTLQGLYGTAYVRGFASSIKDLARQRGYVVEPKTYPVRVLLQELGSEMMADDPLYWVKRYWEHVSALPEFPRVNLLVDDVRYPHEVDWLREKGYRVGYVQAPKEVRLRRVLLRDGEIPFDRLDHPSETAIEEFFSRSENAPDFTIKHYSEAEARTAREWFDQYVHQ